METDPLNPLGIPDHSRIINPQGGCNHHYITPDGKPILVSEILQLKDLRAIWLCQDMCSHFIASFLLKDKMEDVLKWREVYFKASEKWIELLKHSCD